MSGKPKWILTASEEDLQAATKKLTKAVDDKGKEQSKHKRQARA